MADEDTLLDFTGASLPTFGSSTSTTTTERTSYGGQSANVDVPPIEKTTNLTTTTTTITTGWVPLPLRMNMVSKRLMQERKEEEKLSGSTAAQKWWRWWSAFQMEFWSCLIFFTFTLTCRVTGSTLLIQSLGEAFTMIAVLSVWVRENAAHIDPVITVMLVITGRLGLPWWYSLAHLLAQAAAICVATAFALMVTPGFDRSLGLGTPVLAFGYTPGQGLGAQILGCLGMYLVFIMLVTAAGTTNYFESTGSNFRFNTLFALAVGFAHGAASLVLGAIAGTYFHWYLYFFPAVISGTIDTSNWWLWFVGPPAAGFFALCILYSSRWADHLAWPVRIDEEDATEMIETKEKRS